MSNNGAVLQARGINKSFGAVRALKDVDFDARPGEVVGLIGDNWAGKSTLINVITGVLAPDSEEIIFEGERVEFTSPTQVEDLREGNVDVLIAQHPNNTGDRGVRIAVDY